MAYPSTLILVHPVRTVRIVIFPMPESAVSLHHCTYCHLPCARERCLSSSLYVLSFALCQRVLCLFIIVRIVICPVPENAVSLHHCTYCHLPCDRERCRDAGGERPRGAPESSLPLQQLRLVYLNSEAFTAGVIFIITIISLVLRFLSLESQQLFVSFQMKLFITNLRIS